MYTASEVMYTVYVETPPCLFQHRNIQYSINQKLKEDVNLPFWNHNYYLLIYPGLCFLGSGLSARQSARSFHREGHLRGLILVLGIIEDAFEGLANQLGLV